MIKISEMIAKELDEKGLSVTQLANRINVNKNAIYSLLKGDGNNFYVSTAENVAKYFEVNVSDVQEFKNLLIRRVHPKYVKEDKTIVKKKCRNQKCPLNVDGKCNSDQVNLGIAGCMSYDIPKKKEKKPSYKGITINFESTERYMRGV